MAEIYEVTASQLRSIRFLIAQVHAALEQKDGSRLDPAVVESTLTSLLDGIECIGPDPADFLYLTLPAEVLERSINSLQLDEKTGSTKLRTTLLNEGITTLRQLLKYSAEELRKARNFGQKSEEALLAVLNDPDLDLRLHLSPHSTKKLAPPPGDRWIELSRCTRLASQIDDLWVRHLFSEAEINRRSMLYVVVLANFKTIGDLRRATPEDPLKIDGSRVHDSREWTGQFRDLLQKYGIEPVE